MISADGEQTIETIRPSFPDAQLRKLLILINRRVRTTVAIIQESNITLSKYMRRLWMLHNR
jgi:hypothetical protein